MKRNNHHPTYMAIHFNFLEFYYYSIKNKTSILTNYKQGFAKEIVIVISVKRITLIWYMWCKARSDIHTSRSCYFHKLCHLVLIPGDQLQKGVNEVYYQKRIGRKYPPSLPKYLRMMWHYWPEFIPVDAKNLYTGCVWVLTFQPEKKTCEKLGYAFVATGYVWSYFLGMRMFMIQSYVLTNDHLEWTIYIVTPFLLLNQHTKR